MTELNLSLDIICELIKRIRAIQVKEAVVFPEEIGEPSEDDNMQILAEHQNDLTWVEVKQTIDALEPDQQMTLVALMYLGRGDYDAEEWPSCLLAAQQGWTPRTAEYLLAKPYLADYLEAGLSLLERHCEN